MRSRKMLWVALTVVLTGVGLAVQAQNSGPAEDRHQQMDVPADREAMMQRCRQMMQRMQQRRQQMQQMDQELQQRIQAMDQAQGEAKVEAKVEAMAEAIRTLAEQRQQMHQQRQQMMQKMMRHMGQHMMMGPQEGEGRQMMMRCPMMRGGMMQQPQDENPQAAPTEP